MNRQPFNRSGFNRTAQIMNGSNGIALMKLTSSGVPTQIISTPVSKSIMRLLSSAEGTRVIRYSGLSGLVMGGTAKALVIRDGGIGLSTMTMSTFGDQSIQGEAVINLKNDQNNTWLTLTPGDELVINTDDMTVAINSQNGMQYFSMDSDFFKLLSGENKIVYSDGSGSRDILFDIIWKDRWL